jgi:hypothetical protein
MTQEKIKKLTPDEATREAERLFCRGLTRNLIIAHAQENKWGLSASALNSAMDRATERLIEIGSALNLDTEVGKALTRLENLYQEATEAKEIKTALAVEKEIISLLRLGDRVRSAGIDRDRRAAAGIGTPAMDERAERPKLRIAK